MILGIVGSRIVHNISLTLMMKYIPDECTKIVSGGAVGIDSLAKELARMKELNLLEILPDYEIFGKRAPLVRNTSIVKECDKVLAFWDHQSTGTAHTIKECIRMGVAVEIVSIDDITE